MSPRVLPRATKNSALRPSRSSSGWANASAHSAPRCRAGRRKPVGRAARRSHPRPRLEQRARLRHRLAALDREALGRARARSGPARSRGSRRRACRSAAAAPSGPRARGTRSRRVAPSAAPASPGTRARARCPVMQTWWTTARQSTSSGVPRRSSDARSRPRQPRSGDGSVTDMTSGSTSRALLLAQARGRARRPWRGRRRRRRRGRRTRRRRARRCRRWCPRPRRARGAGARRPRARTRPCAPPRPRRRCCPRRSRSRRSRRPSTPARARASPAWPASRRAPACRSRPPASRA